MMPSGQLPSVSKDITLMAESAATVTRLSLPTRPLQSQASSGVAPHLPAILSLASVLVAVLFIVGSYSRVSQTWDEPAHIGTGMEWLARGTYTLDLIDPPLARISAAFGPYLLGSR